MDATDWNKKTRAECAAAAAEGDEAAATALRMHESLDRIETGMQGLREEMGQFEKGATESLERISEQVAALKRTR